MANTQIFNNSYDVAESWSAGGALIKYATSRADAVSLSSSDTSNNVLPFIALDLQLSYSRQTQDLFPINYADDGLKKIQLIGPPTGQLEIRTVLGPTSDIKEFYEAAGKTCYQADAGGGIYIYIAPFHSSFDCNSKTTNDLGKSTSKTRYLLSGVLLNSVQLAIANQAAYTMVSQPLNFTFNKLELVS